MGFEFSRANVKILLFLRQKINFGFSNKQNIQNCTLNVIDDHLGGKIQTKFVIAWTFLHNFVNFFNFLVIFKIFNLFQT